MHPVPCCLALSPHPHHPHSPLELQRRSRALMSKTSPGSKRGFPWHGLLGQRSVNLRPLSLRLFTISRRGGAWRHSHLQQLALFWHGDGSLTGPQFGFLSGWHGHSLALPATGWAMKGCQLLSGRVSLCNRTRSARVVCAPGLLSAPPKSKQGDASSVPTRGSRRWGLLQAALPQRLVAVHGHCAFQRPVDAAVWRQGLKYIHYMQISCIARRRFIS